MDQNKKSCPVIVSWINTVNLLLQTIDQVINLTVLLFVRVRLVNTNIMETIWYLFVKNAPLT